MKTKLLSLLLLTAAFSSAFAQGKQDVINSIKKVNNYWQEHNSAQCRGFWDNAAYFTGNQAVYELTGEQKYLDYAIKWAEYNHWKGATQTDKRKWRYKTYGEGMDFVLFADWQICFQVYIDLYKLEHRAERRKEHWR